MFVAIEIGGTFTDLIAVGSDGRYIQKKVRSTPEDPCQGALNALSILFEEYGVKPKDIQALLHGSTVGTNAVIQRKGPMVGLLITEGFKDVPFIQRQHRGKELYNWRFKKPKEIVSRRAIGEIRERVDSDGNILVPMKKREAAKAIEDLLKRNKDLGSLGVCFLHSYVNPTHEKQIKEIILNEYPDLYVCISSEILPQFREYERTSTTLLTAFMKPIVQSYLSSLEEGINAQQIGGELYVCRSSGGVLPTQVIIKYPAEMLMSGPAAGVTGAVYLSRQSKIDNIMTVDMGGTSTDVSLITSRSPEITTGTTLDGLPLSIPMFDIATVGAGGGSIAYIDQGGMMRVGPQSAGAKPGPACYNMGGKNPTITDALLLIGLIRKENFIAGKMPLSVEMSEKAMKPLAENLRNSEYEISEKIYKIAVSNVAQAMRIVSIERGYDPRDYILCAYGGAGPLFAAHLAKELNLKKSLIPTSPGTFSAWGLVVSDFKRDYVQSFLRKITDVNYGQMSKIFNSLCQIAIDEFKDHSIPIDDMDLNLSFDLRYVGQQYELNVPVSLEELKREGPDLLGGNFNEIHKRRYGHHAPGEEIEIVNARVSAISYRRNMYNKDAMRGGGSPKETTAETSRIFYDGHFIECQFVKRESLTETHVYSGPIVIEEETATAFVPPGFRAYLGELRSLYIEEVK